MLVTAPCFLLAQNTTPPVTYTLKGVLLDSLSMEGEPYATIRISKKQAPDKPVKLAVTDTNGKFQEQITGSGDYIMSITSIGKTSVVKEFTLEAANRTMDFGTLFTKEDTNELGAVEVIAQKPLVKVDIDKIEYNIEDDPDSKTNSMLEMLRKVPLVTVDGEDNIQVNGSSSFKVHVNGKPNNMMSNNPKEVLKSMPANSIKYIEVITDPGAKYDAEGVGGILNIVTIGGGFEGYTVTLGTNISNRGAGGSAYGTVQKGKFTVTGNYAYNYNDNPRTRSSSLREFTDTTQASEKYNGSNKGENTFQHGNMEASYEIDTLRLITMAFGMYGGSFESNGRGETNKRPDYYYRTFNNNDNGWYSIRGNIDYQRLFSVKERMLTFSYRISSQPETNKNRTDYEDEEISEAWKDRLAEDLVENRLNAKTNTIEHTFQGDYVTPIGKIHTIETGLKYIIRNNTSDSKYYETLNNKETLDQNRSVDYEHLNNIMAAYLGYTLRYKDLSGKAGLRYEHTMLDVKYNNSPEYKDFDRTYNNLVPSVSAGIKLGQTQNLRGGYNMRIWRPSIYFLNPYEDKSNPTNYSKGNSELDTEISHAFNISYSSFTSKFNINLSLRHSFNNNSIERYSYIKDGIQRNTFANIGKSRYTGLSAYVNWNASPKTRIYMNISGGHNQYKLDGSKIDLPGITIPDKENSGWDLYTYGGIQHTFPWEIRGSLNINYSTPRTTLQGKNGGFIYYGFNVNKSFLDKRLTVTAFTGNIFTKYTKFKSTIETEMFKTTSENEWSNQRFGISVSYRIGDLKAQVKKAARSIDNDDVKGGGGGGEGGGGN